MTQPPQRLSVIVLCLALLGVIPGTTRAAGEGDLSPYELKVAFLFNISHLVEWPETAFDDDRAKIVFTVLGDDPFGPVLEKALGKECVDGRCIRVERVDKLEDESNSHMLFVAPSHADQLPAVLKHVQGRPVLVISDREAGALAGAAIGFKTSKTKVLFVVNRMAAEAASLKLKSHLLLLADSICETQAPPEG